MPKIILKADGLGVVIVLLPFKKPKLEVYIFNRPTLASFSMMEFTTTGFELMHHDSGNTIHFSIFTMQIFPPSKKITIPKYNGVSYSYTEKLFLLLLKTISYACVMFNENCFIDTACTLKLRVINPSYLRNVPGWQSFYKPDPRVSAVK